MIKGVILDLDDTVCLTEAVCFEIENTVLKEIGANPMNREIHLKTWGKPLYEIISTRSPGVDLVAFKAKHPEVIARFVADGRLDAIPEENFKAMDDLIALGKDLVVVTSREHGELAHLLEPDHGLANRISAFHYKDTMKFHKPDPRAFGHIEAEHGWKPEECIYVGDSLGDARAAKGAGLYFIASLESGVRTKEEFMTQKDALPDLYISRFSEVLAAVKQLDSRIKA